MVREPGTRFYVAKWRVFCHSAWLQISPARFKQVYFDSAQVFDNVSEIATPVSINAMEPALFGVADGSIIMAWTEPDGTGFAVKTATLKGGNWSRPVTITTSYSLFVNWADFPTVAAFNDGTLAVSWLQKNTNIPYAYDINIALSSDAGQTWGSPIVPHDDQSTR